MVRGSGFDTRNVSSTQHRPEPAELGVKLLEQFGWVQEFDLWASSPDGPTDSLLEVGDREFDDVVMRVEPGLLPEVPRDQAVGLFALDPEAHTDPALRYETMEGKTALDGSGDQRLHVGRRRCEVSVQISSQLEVPDVGESEEHGHSPAPFLPEDECLPGPDVRDKPPGRDQQVAAFPGERVLVLNTDLGHVIA